MGWDSLQGWQQRVEAAACLGMKQGRRCKNRHSNYLRVSRWTACMYAKTHSRGTLR
jgi:hypothetical protein